MKINWNYPVKYSCLTWNNNIHTARARELNDQFRKTMKGGRVVFSRGIMALPVEKIPHLLFAIASMNAADFSAGDDPFGEHDFGAVEFEGIKIMWKIDCFSNEGLDPSRLYCLSVDPADPSVTDRVMTVMLAGEY